MKKFIRRFTLVEMLTVIAIISILAGLVIPVVVIAQERGRETQAKSDITALMSALKQLDTDYGRMLKKDGSDYKIGDQKATLSKSDVLKSDGTTSEKDNSLARISSKEEDTYNAFIAELSSPKNKKLDGKISVNRRKKMYLEPKKGFDPTDDYDKNDAQKATLWRDPWGNPYTIYIKLTRDSFIQLPDSTKKVASDIAIYSLGPNGTDDKGCNVALDSCVNSGDSANHKLHDDIASWDL